jgi:hypothetical protein
MPNLNGLLDRSAIAALATRTISRTVELADGYVTLGAGTRAVGAGPRADGEAFDAGERLGSDTAAQVFARRTGREVDAGLVHLGIAAIESDNASELYDAEVGALGDALAGAGVDRAVVANADGGSRAEADPDFYRRQAVAGLMGSNGVVPAGTVDDRLLEQEPLAPFGVRFDNRAVLRAFRAAWEQDSVVLVEASDVVRQDAYRELASQAERARSFRQALRHTDRLVGGLLAEVDLERDAVMVVGPAAAEGEVRLTLAALHAPGFEPGLLRSGATQRSGYVQLVDVAPTILDQLGIERPESMEGRAVEQGDRFGSAAERRQFLEDSDASTVFRDDQVAVVAVIMVVAGGILGAATIVSLLRRELRWLPRLLTAAALGFLGFIPAVYLARLIPFYDLGMPAYYTFLVVTAVVLAFAYSRLGRRHGLDPVILALVAIVLLLVIDAITGAPLQFNSALGYSPKTAGRFTGLGNLGYAALTSSAVLLAGLVAHRIGGRAGPRLAVGLLAVVFVVDGLPFWGSDVGGILSVLPAYGVTAYLLLGLRVRVRTIALWLVVTAMAVVIFGLVDLARESDQRTHLGRLFERIGDEGWSSFETVVVRKAGQNLDTIGNSVWLWMIVMVVLFVAYLVVRERALVLAIFDRVPELRAAAIGFAILAVLGYALNDSGVAVPGMMLGIANAVLVCLLAWIVPRTRSAPSTTETPEPVAPVREPVHTGG